ncbi:MAG: hypothetical protein AABX38_00250 [Candidatus Micrarchaeota archaeon]
MQVQLNVPGAKNIPARAFASKAPLMGDKIKANSLVIPLSPEVIESELGRLRREQKLPVSIPIYQPEMPANVPDKPNSAPKEEEQKRGVVIISIF